jgi:hypothetical protein
VVDEIAGAEYSIDGINWQTENTFTGINPSKDYKVQVRLTGADAVANYNATKAFAVLPAEAEPIEMTLMIVLLAVGAVVLIGGLAVIIFILVSRGKKSGDKGDDEGGKPKKEKKIKAEKPPKEPKPKKEKVVEDKANA